MSANDNSLQITKLSCVLVAHVQSTRKSCTECELLFQMSISPVSHLMSAGLRSVLR